MTEPRGSLMPFSALNCGHPVMCYSLEPTPTLCNDCANSERRVLVDIIEEISCLDVNDLVFPDDLDEWLDEFGINNPEMRKDIGLIAQHCEDIGAAIDSAERFSRKILEKYPEVKVGKR